MIAKTRFIFGAALIAVSGALAQPTLAEQPAADPTVTEPTILQIATRPGTDAVPVKPDTAKTAKPNTPNTPNMTVAPGRLPAKMVRAEIAREGFVKIGKLRLILRKETKVGVFGPKKVSHAGSYYTAVAKTKAGKAYRLYIDAKTGKTFAKKRVV